MAEGVKKYTGEDFDAVTTVEAVSYTHLDVYKRQNYYCVLFR